MKLSGWGGFPVASCEVLRPRSVAELVSLTRGRQAIARGMGRAYGDSALNRAATLDMTGLNRMIGFDPQSGVATLQAGVVLGDVIGAFLPRGWFPAVTPGTKFVTIGGMIAADVHGKNHHKHGSFGNFVEWIDILRPDGEVLRCSRTENADLFAWTIGGMGLTGIVLGAAIRLTRVESAWIRQRTIPAPGLDAIIDAFENADEATYSVAWIDCLATGASLGRSLLMLGEHAGRDELDPARRAEPFSIGKRRSRSVPVMLPGAFLNRWSVRAFNELYYRRGARARGDRLVDWDSYFYPLDSVLHWNRIYGRRGFLQFQCVLPLEASRAGLRALLGEISRSGEGSFLAVLKRLGPQESRFSFPMEGYTLALDFPLRRGTLALLERLDAITLAHGGRFYLAKDARMRAAVLRASDPRVEDFVRMRRESGAATRLASLQSERLEI